jgi:DNA-binding transcriptional MerR regulator
MTTALARRMPFGIDIEAFARATGLHPEMVRRLVDLGLLDPVRDATGDLRFPPAQVAVASRLMRLRAGFSLNYAALALVCDLLDRIAELEAAAPHRNRLSGGRTWTPNG